MRETDVSDDSGTSDRRLLSLANATYRYMVHNSRTDGRMVIGLRRGGSNKCAYSNRFENQRNPDR